MKADKKAKPEAAPQRAEEERKEPEAAPQRAEAGRLIVVTDGACRVEIHPSDLDRFVKAGWRRA